MKGVNGRVLVEARSDKLSSGNRSCMMTQKDASRNLGSKEELRAEDSKDLEGLCI